MRERSTKKWGGKYPRSDDEEDENMLIHQQTLIEAPTHARPWTRSWDRVVTKSG